MASRVMGLSLSFVGVDPLAGRIHRVVIFCSLALLALLVAASLIPAKWQLLRTGLGWQSDHFLGFFVPRQLSASLGRGRSWSGPSSWPLRRCWKACRH